MNMFEAPKWDVNTASEKLNKELFGSKSKKKKLKISQIGTNHEKTIVSNTTKQKSGKNLVSTLGTPEKKQKKKKKVKKNIVNDGENNVPQTSSPVGTKQGMGGSPFPPGTKLTKSQKRMLRKKRFNERKISAVQSNASPQNLSTKSQDQGAEKKKKKKNEKINSIKPPSIANVPYQKENKMLKLSRWQKKKLKKKAALERNPDISNNVSLSTVNAGSCPQKKKKKKNKMKSLDDLLKQNKQDKPVTEDENSSNVSKKKKRRRRKKKKNSSVDESEQTPLNTIAGSQSSSEVQSTKTKKQKHVLNNGMEQKMLKFNKNSSTIEESGLLSPKKKRKRKHSVASNIDPLSETPNMKRQKAGSAGSEENGEMLHTPSPQKMKKKKKKKAVSNTDEEFPSPVSGGSPDSNSPRFIHKLKQIMKNQQDSNSPPSVGKKKNKGGQAENLRERMLNQLQASRFRYLNEQLYTCEGKDALKLFRSDPDAFEAYHRGYEQQVAQWPLNPLDKIIKVIKKKPENLVIADFGCGDGKLARSVPHKVHSFDLIARSEEVTACDMAHTPLDADSVDIVVFCLSLMGTNLSSYILEANRVLKEGGLLKIAEVESRFENVDGFIKNLTKFGFVNTLKDLSHNLFYFMDFKKQSSVKYSNKLPLITLKPCLYKKR